MPRVDARPYLRADDQWLLEVPYAKGLLRLVKRLGGQARRRNRISVGPTALTPNPARIERYTAPVVAAKLADRLGALTPANTESQKEPRRGYLYSPTFKPPNGSLDELRRFFAELKDDPDYRAMLNFWMDIDVAFLSVSSVTPEGGYQDMRRRLEKLGMTTQDLIDRGATALVANRFLDDKGRDVPLAEGVPSYEVAMPTEAIRKTATKLVAGSTGGLVVLDAWGPPASPAHTRFELQTANVLLCDTDVAYHVTQPAPFR